MKRKTQAIIAVVIASLVLIAYIEVFMLDVEANKKFIEILPSRIRTFYLDRVFSIRDEDCYSCRFRLVSALNDIQDDAEFYKNSYHYDYTKIFPFVKDSERDIGGFSEPVNEIACNIIILSNDRKLFMKMEEEYRKSPDVLYYCVIQANWIEQRRPAQYQDILQNLRSIPGFAPTLKRLDELRSLSERGKPTVPR